MKAHRNWSALALSSTVLALSSQVYANPEVAMDFSQSITRKSVGIDTVLNTVTVTCPTDPDAGNFGGHLVATASAQFAVEGVDTVVAPQLLSYYLKKDGVFAGDHRYQFDISGLVQLFVAPPIQRVDTCNEGQTVKYEFQAKKPPTGFVTADKPRLVVVFYKDKI